MGNPIEATQEPIIERISCIDPVKFMAAINETPCWARWIDGRGDAFLRIKPEYWERFNGQAFLDATGKVYAVATEWAITALEIRPEDRARYGELMREMYQMARASIGPHWTFMEHSQPIFEIVVSGRSLPVGPLWGEIKDAEAA